MRISVSLRENRRESEGQGTRTSVQECAIVEAQRGSMMARHVIIASIHETLPHPSIQDNWIPLINIRQTAININIQAYTTIGSL